MINLSMLYLVDSFDPSLLAKTNNGHYLHFTMWQTTEDRVKRLITNWRCRSVFERNEIINLFSTGKIQVVKCRKFDIKPYDQIIVWTKNKEYFIIELTRIEQELEPGESNGKDKKGGDNQKQIKFHKG